MSAGTAADPPPGRRWALDGLAPRLAALLTVALLPLGLIALDQTRGLSEEASRRSELSLLSRTRDAAAPLHQAVERALGAAEALAGLAAVPAAAVEAAGGCAALLSQVAGPGSPYAFVGIVPREEPVTCSTGDGPFGVGDLATLAERLPDALPRVGLPAPDSPNAGEVLVVTTPYAGAAPDGGRAAGRPGEPQGQVVLALRRDRIPGVGSIAAAPGSALPLGLIVFNADGEVVGSAEGATDLLPPGFDLRSVAGGGGQVFPDEDAGGDPRVYTVAPLLPGTLYAMGIWTLGQGFAGPRDWAAAPILFPIGMWLASLLVAFWAANRLVVRPVGGLVGRMRRFGADRSLPDEPLAADAPRELREIEAAFRQTAHAILQDEARMENAFRERGVLLREVHHRVKNNLQLISSIISMQMRGAPDLRTRLILRRLQDRVLTLAAIYRSLYTSPDMGQTSVAPVLRAIVEGEVAAQRGRVSLRLDLDEVVLDADKAVPLAFLLAEAVSNAVLQAGQAQGERSVGVTLTQAGSEARLVVTNTTPQAGARSDEPPGARPRAAAGGARPRAGGAQAEADAREPFEGRAGGLGSRLIEAFATQLSGQTEAGSQDGVYRLAVTFPMDAGAAGGAGADLFA